MICDAEKLDEAGCRGAPEWIVEVLSPTTAGHDQIIKRRVYEKAGVRESWLVHPVDRIITRYTLMNNAYGASEIRELTGRQTVGVPPGVEIDWEQVP